MSVVQAEAVVEAPRSIEVHSAGFTVGNTASFKVDGVTLPVPLGRGFVVVELGYVDPVVKTVVDISEQETQKANAEAENGWRTTREMASNG